MSLRHRVAALGGALVLGSAALFTLPSFSGTASAATCTSAVTPTAGAARALQLADRTADQDAALAQLSGVALPDGGWTADGTAGAPQVEPTAHAIAALRSAGSTDPSVPAAQRWLVAEQDSDGAVDGDVRTTAAALPGLAGTQSAAAAAGWLESQLVADGNGSPDHFDTVTGAHDHRLTADAVLGWAEVGASDTVGARAAAAWLGRQASEYLAVAPGADTWARLILVAEASNQSPRAFGPDAIDLVAGLALQQNPAGHWTEDIATQALAVRAFAAVGNDPLVATAAAGLGAQQCGDGGFPTSFGTGTVDPTDPTVSGPVTDPTTTVLTSTTGPTPPTSTTRSTSSSATPPTTGGTGTSTATTSTTATSSGSGGLVLDVGPIAAGSTVSFGFSGFEPHERIRIELHSTPIVLGYIQADSRGAGTATVTIPISVTPGLHEIWLIGESSNLSFSRTVTIEPAAPATRVIEVAGTGRADRTARLSATGASVSPVDTVLVAGVLLLGGVAVLMVSRRRSARH